MMMHTYPYRRPDAHLFYWHDWEVWDQQELVENWRDTLDTSRIYRCSIVLDIDPVLWELSGLPDGQLLFALEAYCSSTLYRRTSTANLPRGMRQIPLSIDVEGWALAKSLELEASVIIDEIADAGVVSGQSVKWARIASSGVTKFTFSPSENILRPIEVSFSATGRRNIPWEITSTFYSETDNFVANLNLYLNSDMKSVVAILEGGGGKPAKWNLNYELMLHATRALSEVAIEVENGQLERTAIEHPESLCAAVKKYADDAALSMEEILDLARDQNAELEGRLKEVASKIVEL